MLNGTFGKWLREFATLVLTQTVQAFLLAVVMTIIIACLGNGSGDAESNQAAGLLAIIALASFSKIEMLVKNIFGVTSQFGDPSLSAGAKGLTAGGVLAMKGASRLKDNVGKTIEGNRKINEAKKGLASLPAEDTDSGSGNTNNMLNTGQDSNNNTEKKEDTEKKEETQKVVTDSSIGDTTLKLQGIEGLSQAIQTLSNNIQTQNGGSQREKYEAMLKEGKDMKRSARRENIGAAIGATAGAMAGLAKGEGVAAATLTGAGAGDAIGQASANSTAKRRDYKQRMKTLDEKIDGVSQEEYNKRMSSEATQKSYEKAGMKAPGSTARAIGKTVQNVKQDGVRETVKQTVVNTQVVQQVSQKGVKGAVKDSVSNSGTAKNIKYQANQYQAGKSDAMSKGKNADNKNNPNS